MELTQAHWLDRLVSTWWSWMEHAAFEGSLVAAGILIVVTLGRKWPSPLRYTLLLIGLINFAFPPSITAPTGLIPSSSIELANSEESMMVKPTISVPLLAQEPSPVLGSEEVASSQAPMMTSPSSRNPRFGVTTVLAGFYVLGLLVMLALIGRQIQRLRRLVRNAQSPKDASIEQGLATAQRDLNVSRSIRLLVSPDVGCPMSFGVIRPTIMIPPHTQDLSKDAIAAVLSHEVAHHRRHDLVVNIAQVLFSAVLWFHPLVWWVNRKIRQVREECCDDLLLARGVTDGGVYCDALLSAATRTGIQRSLSLSASFALHPLGSRLRRILDQSLRRHGRLSLLGGLVVMATSLFVLPSSPVDEMVPSDDSDPTIEEASDEGEVFQGTVRDREGQGLEGVALRIVSGGWGRVLDREAPVRATSGADGSFSFKLDVGSLSLGESGMKIVASKEGYGPVWRDNPKGALSLVMAQAITVHGQIVDLEGQPVPDANVRVTTISRPKQGSLQPFLDAVEAKDRSALSSNYSFVESTLPWWLEGFRTTTDEEGYFLLEGLPPESFASVLVQGDEIVTNLLNVLTRDIEVVQPDSPHRGAKKTYYGVALLHLASPSRLVEGVVRNAVTGDPIPEIEVSYPGIMSAANMGVPALSNHALIYNRGKTDADGRFELRGFPKSRGMLVSFGKSEDYVPKVIEIPNPEGFDPAEMDVVLQPAHRIRGILVDKNTQRGVPNAEVTYRPAVTNTSGGDHTEFTEFVTKVQTDEKGRFEIGALPGDGFVMVQAGGAYINIGATSEKVPDGLPGAYVFTSYTAIHPINPDGIEGRIQIEVDPGPSITLALIDPEGKPVTGARGWGLEVSMFHSDWTNCPDSEVVVKAFNKEKPRLVAFRHKERELGTLVAANEMGAPVVLKPLAKIVGRLVDRHGDPRPGVPLDLRAQGMSGSVDGQSLMTDSSGEFEFKGLIPGLPYSLESDPDHGSIEDNMYVEGRIELKEGDVRNMGDVVLKAYR